MRSRLYQGRVAHTRFSPGRHRFAYRVFYLAVDLDELPELDERLGLLSVDAPNVFSFRQRDFLPVGEPLHNGHVEQLVRVPAAASLRERVAAVLGVNGIALGAGRVELVNAELKRLQ